MRSRGGPIEVAVPILVIAIEEGRGVDRRVARELHRAAGGAPTQGLVVPGWLCPSSLPPTHLAFCFLLTPLLGNWPEPTRRAQQGRSSFSASKRVEANSLHRQNYADANSAKTRESPSSLRIQTTEMGVYPRILFCRCHSIFRQTNAPVSPACRHFAASNFSPASLHVDCPWGRGGVASSIPAGEWGDQMM